MIGEVVTSITHDSPNFFNFMQQKKVVIMIVVGTSASRELRKCLILHMNIVFVFVIDIPYIYQIYSTYSVKIEYPCARKPVCGCCAGAGSGTRAFVPASDRARLPDDLVWCVGVFVVNGDFVFCARLRDILARLWQTRATPAATTTTTNADAWINGVSE